MLLHPCSIVLRGYLNVAMVCMVRICSNDLQLYLKICLVNVAIVCVVNKAQVWVHIAMVYKGM
jgi:hypothetical protein